MKKFLFIAGLALTAFYAKAQTPPMPADPTHKNITPPSPDAWNFMKYGEYPVSRETGVPNISIPLYTISSGELSVPITLSYHASGIKVDEVASWVGLGWTLNAGGMISRTIKGLPDESTSGLLYMEDMHIHYFDENGVLDFTGVDIGVTIDYENIMRMRNRQLDSEPDMFNYNFGGYSGRFYLDPKTKSVVQPSIYRCKGVTQPKSDVDIEVTIKDITSTNRRITKIVATTPDGAIYSFEVICEYSDGTVSGNSSWYLSQIQSPNKTESITFFYKDFGGQVMDSYVIETDYLRFHAPGVEQPFHEPQSYYGYSSTYNGMKLLDRIEFTSGKVVFNTADDRTDDYYRRLTSIDIFNKTQAVPVKSFVLGNNDYFVSTQPGTQGKRLKLSSLAEVGADSHPSPPYLFTYLEQGNNQLPPRHSFAQDYWGYYNGRISNVSLVPFIDLGSFAPPQDPSTGEIDLRYYFPAHFTLGSANREPDSSYVRAGIISQIKYPTGGSSTFSFASNTVKYDYIRQNTSYTPRLETAFVNPGTSIKDLIAPSFTIDKSYIATLEYHITDITGTGPGYVGNSNALVEMYDLTDNVVILTRASQAIDGLLYVELKKGHEYQLHARSNFTNIVATLTLTWQVPPVVTAEHIVENRVVGGLRIAKIRNFDSDGGLISEKKYSYYAYDYNGVAVPAHTVTSFSSGNYNSPRLPEPISYVSRSEVAYIGTEYDRTYGATAFPAHQIGFPAGDGVSYEYVTETVTGSGAGKTIYHYDVKEKDGYFPAFNNSVTLDRSWLRGQILDEFYYDESNHIVKEVKYSYDTLNVRDVIIRGVKIDVFLERDIPTLIEDLSMFRHWLTRIQVCDELIQWKRLASKTEIMDGVTTTTTFEYHPQMKHTNVVGIRTKNSRNETERTSIRYAHELNNTSLINKNMTGIPLESDVTVNGVLTAGSRVTYGCPGGCPLVLPVKYEQRLDNGAYRFVSEINSVNASGTPEEYKTGDGIVTAIKWDYNNENPIAKAVNATTSQVAFTSFENGSSEGGWTYSMGCIVPTTCLAGCPDQYADPYGYSQCYYACNNTYNQCLISDAASQADSKTGRKSFTGTSIGKSGLPSGNYVVSFWAKKIGATNGSITITGVVGAQAISATEWTFYQFPLTAVTGVTIDNVGGYARIDELRLQPAGSLMTTYSVAPLIGVTAMTDPSSKVSYYEYDAMIRLKLIRDDKKNILKKYIYNYKDQN